MDMTLAIAAEYDIPTLPSAVSRVYAGERFCVRRHLEALSRLRRLAERVKAAGKEMYVFLPSFVPEREMAALERSLEEIEDLVDGVVTGSFAASCCLASGFRTVYLGCHYDPASRRILAGAGVASLWAFPPYIECLASAQPELPIEVEVFGRPILGASPRCFVRLYYGCSACDRQLVFRGDDDDLFLTASHYRPAKHASAMEFADLLGALGVARGIVSLSGLGAEQIEAVCGSFAEAFAGAGNSGGHPTVLPVPAGEMSNGLYFNRPGSIFHSVPWGKRLRDARSRVLRLRDSVTTASLDDAGTGPLGGEPGPEARSGARAETDG